jgi:type III secretion protein V
MKLLRDGLQYELGHKQIPGISIRGNESDLADGTYIILINEIPLVSGNVNVGKVFVDKTVEQLKFLGIQGEETINPANGSECAWIPSELKEKAEKSGVTVWDPVEYMIFHLFSVLRRNFTEFITVQDTSEEIELKASRYSQEINDAPGGIVRFTNVLKILAEEDVTVKELGLICEIYLSQKDSPVYDIVEELRCHEKIRPLLAGNKFSNEYCNVYQLGSDITSLIATGIFTNGDASLLAIEPQPTQDILTAIREKVKDLPPATQNPVIMTEDSRIRRHVRKLVELEFPYLAVMSKREIIKKVQTLATITLE